MPLRRLALALRDPKHAFNYLKPAVRRTRRVEDLFAQIVPSMLVLDIGAAWFSHGRWRLFRMASNAHWVLIDPIEESLAYADAWPYPSKVSKVVTAAAASDGPLRLYLTNVATGSSTYRPSVPEAMKDRVGETGLAYFFPVQETIVDALSLQSILQDARPSLPIIMKLDTQGSELEIVRSAEEWLLDGTVVGVELEATLLATPLYEGVPHFWQIQEWFESIGWELLSIHVIEASPGGDRKASRSYAAECDAVFAPRRDRVGSLGEDACLALLCFYVANRLYSEAASLLSLSPSIQGLLATKGVDLNDLEAALRGRYRGRQGPK